MRNSNRKAAAFKAAFPHTIPILAGFTFLGIGFGLMMEQAGFSVLYPILMSVFIFGGSIEYIAVGLLVAPFAPWQTFIIAIMVQARHIFYGIAMLKRFEGQGAKKPYLIFAMCDETFAINYSARVPKDIDRGWFMFFVSVLNHAYWIFGSALGWLAGSLIPFDLTGVDFVMTALFIVIFLEQYLKDKQKWSSLLGFGAAIVCLQIFGGNSFMVPTMVVMLILLTIFRKPIEKPYLEAELSGDENARKGGDV